MSVLSPIEHKPKLVVLLCSLYYSCGHSRSSNGNHFHVTLLIWCTTLVGLRYVKYVLSKLSASFTLPENVMSGPQAVALLWTRYIMHSSPGCWVAFIRKIINTLVAIRKNTFCSYVHFECHLAYVNVSSVALNSTRYLVFVWCSFFRDAFTASGDEVLKFIKIQRHKVKVASWLVVVVEEWHVLTPAIFQWANSLTLLLISSPSLIYLRLTPRRSTANFYLP